LAALVFELRGLAASQVFYHLSLNSNPQAYLEFSISHLLLLPSAGITGVHHYTWL
jgi:hypothetical protein